MSSQLPKFNFAGATVLTVDRDEFCQKILSSMLRGFGFQTVLRAKEIDEATRIIESRDVDFLVIDPVPYAQAGFEFVGRLRSEGARALFDSTVFLSTGHATQNILMKMTAAGADYVICKPYSPQSLLQRMIWVAQKTVTRGATVELAPSIG